MPGKGEVYIPVAPFRGQGEDGVGRLFEQDAVCGLAFPQGQFHLLALVNVAANPEEGGVAGDIRYQRGVGCEPAPVAVLVTNPALQPLVFPAGGHHLLQEGHAGRKIFRMNERLKRAADQQFRLIPQDRCHVGCDIGDDPVRRQGVNEVIGPFHHGAEAPFARLQRAGLLVHL